MFLSVFDLFKIGIGPSSSHTMGPMTASNLFLEKLDCYTNKFGVVQNGRIKVFLYGSLAFTGIGHATDISVILGLMGEEPHKIDPDMKEFLLNKIAQEKSINSKQNILYNFDPKQDLIFNYDVELPGHPNGLAYDLYNEKGDLLFRQVYYSVGGGFVVTEEDLLEKKVENNAYSQLKVPYPFATAAEMLAMAKDSKLSIAQMKRANELCFMSEKEFDTRLDNIWDVMQYCIARGMKMQGELPGGLGVKRRARDYNKVLRQKMADKEKFSPFIANDFLTVIALAVNEENAAGGRIVTAPTNGAAGVIPAVLSYYNYFYDNHSQEVIRDFLCTSAAIGGLIKVNASISGAEVGCQGEVGSASSMAAAGLTACLGGSPEQIENAAEIALEHHLGLTCDPVAGLVQVPCIERNAMGAIKAVSASSIAMLGNGEHFVSLDACIKTMKETGLDLNSKYKETSLAGLAINVLC